MATLSKLNKAVKRLLKFGYTQSELNDMELDIIIELVNLSDNMNYFRGMV